MLQDFYHTSAPAFDPVYNVKSGGSFPLLWFGIFSKPEEKQISSHGDFSVAKWEPSITMEEYIQAISSIKKSIQYGNTYQTNYTIRLHSQFSGDSLAYYNRLKKHKALIIALTYIRVNIVFCLLRRSCFFIWIMEKLRLGQ